IKRLEDVPLKVEPLIHFEDAMPWNKRSRLLISEIVHVSPVRPLDLQDVPEPLRGDEACLRSFPLGNRIDDDSRTVSEETGKVLFFESALPDDLDDPAR